MGADRAVMQPCWYRGEVAVVSLDGGDLRLTLSEDKGERRWPLAELTGVRAADRGRSVMFDHGRESTRLDFYEGASPAPDAHDFDAGAAAAGAVLGKLLQGPASRAARKQADRWRELLVAGGAAAG